MTPGRAIPSLDWRGAGAPGGDLVLRRASVLDPRAEGLEAHARSVEVRCNAATA